MENLCDLLFELSNEDRLRILHQLNKKAMNVTNLSKTLDLTTQESSRHVSRLGEVGLTQKDVEGLHSLTPYGELVLKQLEGLEFISQHRDYFATHSLVHLLPEFICRLGDLADSAYVNDISAAFFSVEKVIQEAEEYILTITDQYLLNINFLIGEACERGVKAKNIEAKDWFVSPEIIRAYRAEDAKRQAIILARTTGLLEERILKRLDIYLFMSEKEVAVVGFPFPDGKFDYLGFTSKDERSHKWCRDLFQYYWERARNRGSVVEELYRWAKKRPRAIYALKNIATGKEFVYEKDLISEFERLALTNQGKLTLLGLFVYERLQQ